MPKSYVLSEQTANKLQELLSQSEQNAPKVRGGTAPAVQRSVQQEVTLVKIVSCWQQNNSVWQAQAQRVIRNNNTGSYSSRSDAAEFTLYAPTCNSKPKIHVADKIYALYDGTWQALLYEEKTECDSSCSCSSSSSSSSSSSDEPSSSSSGSDSSGGSSSSSSNGGGSSSGSDGSDGSDPPCNLQELCDKVKELENKITTLTEIINQCCSSEPPSDDSSGSIGNSSDDASSDSSSGEDNSDTDSSEGEDSSGDSSDGDGGDEDSSVPEDSSDGGGSSGGSDPPVQGNCLTDNEHYEGKEEEDIFGEIKCWSCINVAPPGEEPQWEWQLVNCDSSDGDESSGSDSSDDESNDADSSDSEESSDSSNTGGGSDSDDEPNDSSSESDDNSGGDGDSSGDGGGDPPVQGNCQTDSEHYEGQPEENIFGDRKCWSCVNVASTGEAPQREWQLVDCSNDSSSDSSSGNEYGSSDSDDEPNGDSSDDDASNSDDEDSGSDGDSSDNEDNSSGTCPDGTFWNGQCCQTFQPPPSADCNGEWNYICGKGWLCENSSSSNSSSSNSSVDEPNSDDSSGSVGGSEPPPTTNNCYEQYGQPPDGFNWCIDGDGLCYLCGSSDSDSR